MSLKIRPARRSDAALIHEFIVELARFEGYEDAVTARVEDIEATFFNAAPKVYGLIAELDGAAVGFAVYFYNYSTFQGRFGIYLEDLFVRQSHRGAGVGKALLARLAKIAVEEKCGRLQWWVLDWNPAIDFYERLGAEPQAEWTVYRLAGDALARLADEAAP